VAEEPRQLKQDIEETRAEMTDTVDAIQERLSPDHIKQEMKEAVRESAYETRDRVQEAVVQTSQQVSRGLMDVIRENPMPAALAGIGIGWLAMAGRSNRGYNGSSGNARWSRGDGDRDYTWSSTGGIADRAHTSPIQGARASMEDAASRVSSTATQMGEQVSSQASELGSQAQQQMQRAQSSLDRMLNENPLAVGLAAIGAGAVIGMLVPETQREQQMMGSTRDAVAETLQERVDEMASKAEEVTSQMSERSAQSTGTSSLTSNEEEAPAASRTVPSGDAARGL
jgi:ElaB/YqjD/DUF883 family membrane-anchored ribosome-binding protein